MIDFDELSFRHLRVLSVIMQERNLTRTAEILDTTQSSISKALARLRVHFQDPLFVRSGLHLEPTPRALALVEPLQSLLALSDSMRSVSLPFDPEVSSREFRLILSDAGMVHFLPVLLEDFATRGPHLRLQALSLDARQFELKLEAGEADIAIGDFPHASSRLRRQKLYREIYRSVARADHPRLSAIQKPEAFLAERHIVVSGSSTGHAAYQIIEKELAGRLAADRIQLRLPSFAAAAMAVKRTDSVLTIPGNLAGVMAREFGLALFRTPIPMAEIEIAQLWHERVQNDPAHRWLRETIFSLFRNKRALLRRAGSST